MISAALEADLHVLSALSGLDNDIEDLVAAMSNDLMAGIPSALGLSVTVNVQGQDVTLTVLDDDNARGVRASVFFPIGARARAQAATCVIFYAGTPGAFVDLAADLVWATGVPATEILVDEHLTLPYEGSTLTGLRELSTINQAIGVLIAHDHTQESARKELDRRAEVAGTSVHELAVEMIRRFNAAPDVD